MNTEELSEATKYLILNWHNAKHVYKSKKSYRESAPMHAAKAAMAHGKITALKELLRRLELDLQSVPESAISDLARILNGPDRVTAEKTLEEIYIAIKSHV